MFPTKIHASTHLQGNPHPYKEKWLPRTIRC